MILTALVAAVVANLSTLAVEALVERDLRSLLRVELHLAMRADGESQFFGGSTLAHQSQLSGFLKGFCHA